LIGEILKSLGYPKPLVAASPNIKMDKKIGEFLGPIHGSSEFKAAAAFTLSRCGAWTSGSGNYLLMQESPWALNFKGSLTSEKIGKGAGKMLHALDTLRNSHLSQTVPLFIYLEIDISVPTTGFILSWEGAAPRHGGDRGVAWENTTRIFMTF